MSNYYKYIKMIILSDYNFFGFGNRILYYLSCALLLSFFYYSFFWEATGGKVNPIILLLIAGVFYLWSRRIKDKILKERDAACSSMISKGILSEKSTEDLIEEINDSLKKMRSFSQWTVGILTTLIVLIVGILANFYFKLLDLVIQQTTLNERRIIIDKVINEFNPNNGDWVGNMFQIGFNLLLLICLPLITTYIFLSMVSYSKKQVLSVLRDCKYIMQDEQVNDYLE